jgi:Fe-S cluster assembly ATP-binding protein
MKLEIKDLCVEMDGRRIINGVNLTVKEGEIHVIMGPNGSGKSTLAKAIMGHPKAKVTKGDILLDGKSITGLSADKRARLGLFLQFQNPVEVEGVGFINFLHSAKQALGGNAVGMKEFMTELKDNISSLKMSEDFIGRHLNQGFSGGEMKKAEILQMAVLKPKIAILDEPDSGLDIDAVKVVSTKINDISKENNMGLLIITHYNRILRYINADHVHVMVGGTIVASGRRDLAEKLEKEGYEPYVKSGAK